MSVEGGEVVPIFCLHICSSGVKITLHEEYQLPRLSGTSLIVCGVEMRCRRGQQNVHTNNLITPGRLKLSQVDLGCDNINKFQTLLFLLRLICLNVRMYFHVKFHFPTIFQTFVTHITRSRKDFSFFFIGFRAQGCVFVFCVSLNLAQKLFQTFQSYFLLSFHKCL